CFAPADESSAAQAADSLAAARAESKPDDLAANLAAAGAPDADITDNSAFKEALTQLRAGNHSAAVRGFDAVAAREPGLADWATYFAAWSAAAAGDIEGAARRVAELHKDFQRDYGWKARAYAYEKANQAARAAAVADSAYRR